MACKHDPTPCPNCGEPRYPMIDHICPSNHLKDTDDPDAEAVEIQGEGLLGYAKSMGFDPFVIEPSRDRPKESAGKYGKIHTYYGFAGTVHQTLHLDIEVDKTTGKVVSVWFRCCALPFKVSVVDMDRSVEMEQMSKRINNETELHAVTIVQMPTSEAGRG